MSPTVFSLCFLLRHFDAALFITYLFLSPYVWCQIIMSFFSTESVFLARTLVLYFSATFSILLRHSGSFECFPCLVLHVWRAHFILDRSSTFGVECR